MQITTIHLQDHETMCKTTEDELKSRVWSMNKHSIETVHHLAMMVFSLDLSNPK